MEDNKKKGLGMVLEGGGMRGLYTAGVLDELMEQGIYADSTVGVSAGAIFGCNYKSRQIGRTLRYNTRFCKDKRYMGLKSWITTGDLYSKDFAYGEVPWKLDVFDTETFARSPMKFTVVCWIKSHIWKKRAGSMLSARTETSVQNRLSVIPPI